MNFLKRRFPRMLLWIIAVVVCVYLLAGAALYLLQTRLVYQPARRIEATPADLGLPYEEVSFETDDGVTLSGWFVPAGKDADVVLLFHGNAGNISHRLDMLAFLHGLDLSVLLIDYRGYGNSRGTPSEKGTYLDAEAAWRFLTRRRGIDPERIVLYGRSLGGAIAARLAVGRSPRGLVVDSGFTSAPDLAAGIYPVFPARRLCRFEYDTLGSIRQVACPILVVHSREDSMVPFEHGRRLFEAAPGRKHFVETTGGHNDPMELRRELLEAGLRAFLLEATSD